ncbi:DUF192 domain-containing protein [Treponema endosymbiont of Eucomonympha sp.]|uniref:DUF192 domain-containing protein n=1 Tax=Treponema endosymbiont of Eucomonympha sp. TaxID=1580831 RepID=UPI0027D31164|nr:DUF192 domain-containing protein [Treponema endosymbiont of Eucomonympha sp.]
MFTAGMVPAAVFPNLRQSFPAVAANPCCRFARLPDGDSCKRSYDGFAAADRTAPRLLFWRTIIVRFTPVPLAAYVVCILSCAASALEKRDLTITAPEGKSVTLRVEVARTEAERSRGFMGRKRIPDGTGMIFVFERDERLRFWMKDTPVPLSIAYIDSAGAVREIYDMTPFSLAPVTSAVSVRYALEVPQGWFARAGIRVGAQIAAVF